MFGNMKAMGAIAGLLQNKDKLRAAGERMGATVERTRGEGASGAGACRAVATGRMRLESVSLDPALVAGLLDAGSRDEAERLVVQAINAALDDAEGKVRAAARAEAKELGLDEVLGDSLDSLGKPGGGIGSLGKLLG